MEATDQRRNSVTSAHPYFPRHRVKLPSLQSKYDPFSNVYPFCCTFLPFVVVDSCSSLSFNIKSHSSRFHVFPLFGDYWIMHSLATPVDLEKPSSLKTKDGRGVVKGKR